MVGVLAAAACTYQKLHPAILMVKSPEYGPYGDDTIPSNRTSNRRVLAQRQMRADTIVVAGVVGEDLAQMSLAEDDDVIEAFPTDRADQSLRMPVLPR